MTTPDWPPLAALDLAARQRLVRAQGEVLRLLLDEAFTTLCDTDELHRYGFRGESPVDEAVAWALDFFASERFQPERVRGDTARLFTSVDLWLSLKVGRRAWRARAATSRVALDPEALPADAAPPERAAQDAAMARVAARMGEALGALRARTCAALVSRWLEGSRALRARVFAWPEHPEAAPEPGSPKQRSLTRHDALFRYLCLYFGWVDDDDEGLRAVRALSFSPCEDARPYQAPVAPVLAAWPQPLRVNALLALRRSGLARLLARALDQAERPPDLPAERLEGLLLRHGLGPSTAHAYKLEDAQLFARLQALPDPEVRG